MVKVAVFRRNAEPVEYLLTPTGNAPHKYSVIELTRSRWGKLPGVE
jgi:hypothetical protein